MVCVFDDKEYSWNVKIHTKQSDLQFGMYGKVK